MKRLFIGDIAKKFGLNPRTIRYYEAIGILPKPIRTESGYRVYSDETFGGVFILFTLCFVEKLIGLSLRRKR